MRGTESSRQQRRRIDRIRLVVVLLVLCSLGFSSIGPGARAQENDQCPEGQVYDEATATCIGAPPVEEVPEEPQEPVPTGSLTISNYICDSDFDAASASTADYFNTCGVPGEGIGFTTAEADGTGTSGNTNGNGYLGFEDLNLDVVSITQSVPDGYSEPFVACAAGDGNTDYAPVDVYGGSSIDIDLAAASYYVCVWFNIAQVGGDISIGITSWDCPNGFAPVSGDQNEFFDNCQLEKLPGVAFSVSNPAGEVSGSGSTDANGKLAFEGLLPDTYVIAETIPAGYESSAAFCTYYDATVTGDFIFETETVTNGAFQHVLNAGDSLVCDVYTVPTPTPTGITIVTYVCDQAALPMAGAGAADLRSVCLADPTPYTFEFQVSDTNGVSEYEIVGAELPGAVRFDAYTPGQVTIYETFPAGFAPPLVFCGVVPVGADQPATLDPVQVLGSFVVLDAPAGDEIECDWFNFPATQVDLPGASDTFDPSDPIPALNPGTSDTFDPDSPVLSLPTSQLFATVTYCPANFSLSGKTLEELRTTCIDAPSEVTFRLSGDNGYASGDILGTWGNGKGQLNTGVFEALPDGHYTLSTALPSGYRAARISCQTAGVIIADSSSGTTSPPPARVTIELDIASDPANFGYYCFIFNEVNPALSDTSDPVVTNIGGPLLEPLPTTPSLGSNSRGGFDLDEPVMPVDTGNGGTFDPNSPYLTIGTSYLVIIENNCPSTFDPARSFQEIYQGCFDDPTGVTFNLTGPNGYSSSNQGRYDDDEVGFLGVFSGLQDGHYTVSVTLPAGYASAYVTCDSSGVLFPTGTGSSSGTFEIDIVYAPANGPDSSSYHCYVYNFTSPYGSDAVIPYEDAPSVLDGVADAPDSQGTVAAIDTGPSDTLDESDPVPALNPGASDTLDPDKPPLSLEPVELPGTSDTLDPDKPPLSLDPVALPTSIPVPGQSIHVVFRNCPVSFDPAGKVIGDFWTACKEFPASSEVITLSLPDGTVQPDAWAGETAEFPNPPVGELAFNTTLQPGFTSRYIGCNTTSFIQADLPMNEFVVIPPDGAIYTFAYDLGPNRFTDCHIFNVRFDAAAEPAAEGAAGLVAAGGAVDVYTWSCPVDYDAGNAGYDDLVADCTTVMSNIQVSVGQVDGEAATGVTGMDGPGMAGFEGVSGDVSIVVELPAGYGTPTVYCGAAGNAAIVPVVDDSAFSLTVTGDVHWSCDVFNTRVAP